MLILTGEKDTEKSSPTSAKSSPLSVRFQDSDLTKLSESQESDGTKVSGSETSVAEDLHSTAEDVASERDLSIAEDIHSEVDARTSSKKDSPSNESKHSAQYSSVQSEVTAESSEKSSQRSSRKDKQSAKEKSQTVPISSTAAQSNVESHLYTEDSFEDASLTQHSKTTSKQTPQTKKIDEDSFTGKVR